MKALINRLIDLDEDFEVESNANEKQFIECKDCLVWQYDDGTYFVSVSVFGKAVNDTNTVADFVSAYHNLCEDNENLILSTQFVGGNE